MEKNSWATICHADFPRAILTQSQCISVIATLERMDSGKQQIQAAIKIGWVRIRCASADTLGWLRGAVARLERKLTCRLIVLSKSPPDFYAIFLDIPTSIMETNDETLRIIQKESPNREFWKIVCATQGSDVHQLVISIPKNSVADLRKVNFTIKFKGQPFTVRLEVYEKNENEYDILSPTMHPILGSDSCSPGFEKQNLGGPSKETLGPADQEKQEEVLGRRLYNYLRKLKVDSKEANERAKNALTKYRKFKLETKKNCSLGKFGYDFFNVEVLYNRLECLQIIDEMAEPPNYSNNTFFILCHKEYPRVFFEPAVLRTIKAKLLDFRRIIPLKVAISQVAVAEGCLKVECGNEGTFKLVARIVECNEFWKILKHDKIPEFRCIQLSIPHKIRKYSKDEFLAKIRKENASLDCRSWCIAGRNSKAGDLSIVMDVTSFEALEMNSFLINYLGNVYHAQPHFHWAEDTSFSNPTQEKEKPEASSPKNEIENSGNVGEMQEEMQKLTGILIEAGIASEEANKRSRAAICMYQQFKLLLSTKLLLTKFSTSKGLIFCNGDIFNDHFENIQLFDEMLTQPVEFSQEKFFILSHSNFPKTFFNQFNLEHISNKLLEFVNELSVKPALGDICIDEGWLTVQYGNEGTLKWLKRVIHFTTSELFPPKVVLKDETPELYFIHLKVPIKSESSSSTLPTLKSENHKLDTSSWEIARRVSVNSRFEIITIIMNVANIDDLKNNSWNVLYFANVYVAEAYYYSVEKGVTQLTPSAEDLVLDPESNALDEMLEETTKLYEHIKALGVSSSEAKERTDKALTIYKQFKVLVKTKPIKKSFRFFNREILKDNMENLLIFDELLTQPVKSNEKHFIICHNCFPKQFFHAKTLSEIKCALSTFIRESPVGLTIGQIVHQEGWLTLDGANDATVKWLTRVLKFSSIAHPLKLLAVDEVSDFVFISFRIPDNMENKATKLENLKKENASTSSWEIAKQFDLVSRSHKYEVLTISMNTVDFEELKMKSFFVQYNNNSYKAWANLYNSEKGVVKLDHTSQIDIFKTERKQLYENLTNAGVSITEAEQRIEAAIDKYKIFWMLFQKDTTDNKKTFFHRNQLDDNNYENLLLYDKILTQPLEYKRIPFILCHIEFPKTFLSMQELSTVESRLTEFLKHLPGGQATINISLERGYLKVDGASEAVVEWLKRVVNFAKTRLIPLKLLTREEISDFFLVTVKVDKISKDDAMTLQRLKKDNSSFNSDSWELVTQRSTQLTAFTVHIKSFEALKKKSFRLKYRKKLFAAWGYHYTFDKGLIRIYRPEAFDKRDNNVFDQFPEEGRQLYEHLNKAGICDSECIERTKTVIDKCKQLRSLFTQKKSSTDSLTFYHQQIVETSLENHLLLDELLMTLVPSKLKGFILCHKNFPKTFFNSANVSHIQNVFKKFLVSLPLPLTIGRISVDEGWLKVDDASEPTIKWLRKVVKFTETSRYPLTLLIIDDISDVFFITVELPRKTEVNAIILKNLKNQNSGLDTASWEIVKRVSLNTSSEIMTITMDSSNFEALKLGSFCVLFNNQQPKVKAYQYSSGKVVLLGNGGDEMHMLKTHFNEHLTNGGMNTAVAQRRAEVVIQKYKEFKLLVEKYSQGHGLTFFIRDIIKDDFLNITLFNNMLTEPVKLSDDKYFILCHLNFPNVFLNQHNLLRIQSKLNEFLNESPVRPAIGEIVVDEGWLIVHFGNDAALNWLKRVVKFTLTGALPLKLLTTDETPEFGFVYLKLPFKTLEMFGIDNLLNCLVGNNIQLVSGSWQIARCAIKDGRDDVTLVMNMVSFNVLKNNSFKLWFQGNIYQCEPYEFSHRNTGNFQTASLEGLQKTAAVSKNPLNPSFKCLSLNDGISTSNMPAEFSPKNEVKKRLTQSLCEMGVDFIAAEQRANMAIEFNEKVATVYGSFSATGVWKNVQMFDAMLTQPVKMSDEHFCIICHSTFPQIFFSTTILDAIINALNSYVGGLPAEPAIGKVSHDEGWVKIHYGNDATLRWLKRIMSFKEFVSLDATLLTRDQIPRFWAVFFNLPSKCCQLDSIPAILQKLKSENGSFDCRSWSIVGRKRKNNFEEFHVVMNEASFGELQEALFNIHYLCKMYIAMPSSLHNYFSLNDSPTENLSGTSKPSCDSESSSVPSLKNLGDSKLTEAGEKNIKEKEMELESKLQRLKQLQLELKLQKLQQEFSAVLKEKEELSSQKPNEILTTADHSQESKDKLVKKSKKKNAKKKKKKSKRKKSSKSSSSSSSDGELRRISRSPSRERKVSRRSRSYSRSRSKSVERLAKKTGIVYPGEETQPTGYSNALVNTPNLFTPQLSNPPHFGVENIFHINMYSHMQVNRNETSILGAVPVAAPLIEQPKDAYEMELQKFYERLQTAPNPKMKRQSSNERRKSFSRSRSRSRDRREGRTRRSRSRSRDRQGFRARRSSSRSRDRPVRRTQRSRSRSRDRQGWKTRRSRSNSRRRSYGSKPRNSKTTLKYDSDKNIKTRYSPSRRRQYRSRSRKRDRTPSVETSQRKTKPRSRSNSMKRKRYDRSSSSSSSSVETKTKRRRSKSTESDSSSKQCITKSAEDMPDKESKTKKRRSKSSESDSSSKQCIMKCAEKMPDKCADDEGECIAELKNKDEKSVVESRDAATESTSKIAEEITAPLAEDMPVALSESEKRLNCSRLMELQGVGNILPVRDEDSFSNPPNPLDNAGEERLHSEFNNFLDELKDLCNYFKGDHTQKPENQEE